MKRFKSSELSRNVAAVIKEAKANGVIIECRKSNGEIEDELVLCLKSTHDSVMGLCAKAVMLGVKE